MIKINTTRYEFEQKSSNFEERLLFMSPENSSQKSVSMFQILHYTINTKKTYKTCKSYKFENKNCHDMIYSDCKWKGFLSLTDK